MGCSGSSETKPQFQVDDLADLPENVPSEVSKEGGGANKPLQKNNYAIDSIEPTDTEAGAIPFEDNDDDIPPKKHDDIQDLFAKYKNDNRTKSTSIVWASRAGPKLEESEEEEEEDDDKDGQEDVDSDGDAFESRPVRYYD